MKITALAAILILCLATMASAQQDSLYPKNTTRTRIWLKDIKKPVKGILFEAAPMSVVLSNSALDKDYKHGTYDVTKFDIRTIESISVKKKNYFLEGGKAGAVVGFITGGAIGCHYYFRTSEHTENVWGDAWLGSLIGAVTGALIGWLVPEKAMFSINGSQVKYDFSRPELKKYSVK
jgi:hypothetical protein